MLELCGQETSLFFTHLFLCQVPAELRIMLLINKDDKLWAMHGQRSNLVATVEQPVEDDPSLLAAVASRGHGGRGGRSRPADELQRPAAAW